MANEWIGPDEEQVIRRYLADCEAEFQAECDKLQAECEADPASSSKKKRAEGARWTLYHMRTIKDRLRKRLEEGRNAA